MSYIDGYVVTVPTASKADYIDFARKVAKQFKRHGATRLVDAWGDDLPEGEAASFANAVHKRDGETVVFAWVQWPSRSVRDDAWKAIMSDSSVDHSDAPFDGKRMMQGGFEVIVDE